MGSGFRQEKGHKSWSPKDAIPRKEGPCLQPVQSSKPAIRNRVTCLCLTERMGTPLSFNPDVQHPLVAYHNLEHPDSILILIMKILKPPDTQEHLDILRR